MSTWWPMPLGRPAATSHPQHDRMEAVGGGGDGEVTCVTVKLKHRDELSGRGAVGQDPGSHRRRRSVEGRVAARPDRGACAGRHEAEAGARVDNDKIKRIIRQTKRDRPDGLDGVGSVGEGATDPSPGIDSTTSITNDGGRQDEAVTDKWAHQPHQRQPLLQQYRTWPASGRTTYSIRPPAGTICVVVVVVLRRRRWQPAVSRQQSQRHQ